MSSSVTDLSNFNATALIRYFDYMNITPVEARALEFLYDREGTSEIADPEFRAALAAEGTGLGRARLIIKSTIQKVQLRYELYRSHAWQFGLTNEQNFHDAMAIAVICDEHAAFIRHPDDGGPKYLDNGFDPDTVELAAYFAMQAFDMEADEFFEDGMPAAPESVFLFHINAYQSLRQIDEEFSAYPDDVLQDRLNGQLRAVQKYAWPDTVLGHDLLELNKSLQERILMRIRPGIPPILRLVPNTGGDLSEGP